MRKIMVLLLILMLCTTSVFGAAPGIQVTMPDQKDLVENQYIVSVEISDNPGFASLQVELFYNSAVLTCTKVLPGDVLKSLLTDTNPKASGERSSAILSAAGVENTMKNGTLVSFVFEKPKAGDPEFEFILTELRSWDGKKVDAAVTVKNNYGEIISDGGGSSPGGSGDGSGSIAPAPNPPVQPSVPVAPVNPQPPVKPIITFSDVSDRHWASSYIKEAVALGILSGYTNGTFLPDKEMTRAEFATLLWNMKGKPAADTSLAFADVKAGDWFYPQVAWAFENGYIKGVTDKEFRPNGKITREQAMTILYRFTGCPEATESLGAFVDRVSVSAYALPAMNWAVENKIISGTDKTHVSPKANATRAQLSTIIVRYLNAIN